MMLTSFSLWPLGQRCTCNLFVAIVLVFGLCSQAGAQTLPSSDQVKGVKSADRFDVQRLDAINVFMEKAVEDGAAPLHILLLQEASQQDEGLPPDDLAGVTQAGGNLPDVNVDQRGVAHAQITQCHDDVVPHSGGIRGRELPEHQGHDVFG